MTHSVYTGLMSGRGGGDPFDRHLFACVIAAALPAGPGPLSRTLGLSGEMLAALVGRHFPHAPALLAGVTLDAPDDAPQSPEEPDLRALLIDYRRGLLIEEEWLAHIIARASLGSNHLWQDLGLVGRCDLSALMRRHFPDLAALNAHDMKWKKFLYRELCRRDGLIVCKSPNCEVCTDYAACFGAESGVPLALSGGLS